MLISVDTRTYLLAKIIKLRNERAFLKKSFLKKIIILSENAGPQKFLSDLVFLIEKNGLSKITYNCFKSNFHLINSGFYSPLWRHFRPKIKQKVVLRLDGIGIDGDFADKEKIKSNLSDLIDKSSFLIYQSKFSKNCFLDIFESLPEGKIIVNGALDIKFVSEYAVNLYSYLNRRFNGKFFSVAGRFSSRKRINEVINQFNESDIGNLVVLSNVPDKLKYNNPRIIYLGMINPDSARYIISKSEALIHFDRYDWCPNIVVGAIHDKIPVICSNFGGTPEITGKNGLIIKEFPKDLPENLEGINYAKKSVFPSKIFKEIISDIYLNGIKISFTDKFDMNDTAHNYVKTISKRK